jgi:hypothetical protein
MGDGPKPNQVLLIFEEYAKSLREFVEIAQALTVGRSRSAEDRLAGQVALDQLRQNHKEHADALFDIGAELPTTSGRIEVGLPGDEPSGRNFVDLLVRTGRHLLDARDVGTFDTEILSIRLDLMEVTITSAREEIRSMIRRALPGRQAAAGYSHSADYTRVAWAGQSFAFTPTQARALKLLWEDWEDGGGCLAQSAIGDSIGSTAEPYRVSHTFRTKGKQHPAWRVMFRTGAKGVICLNLPDSPQSPENHQ